MDLNHIIQQRLKLLKANGTSPVPEEYRNFTVQKPGEPWPLLHPPSLKNPIKLNLDDSQAALWANPITRPKVVADIKIIIDRMTRNRRGPAIAPIANYPSGRFKDR